MLSSRINAKPTVEPFLPTFAQQIQDSDAIAFLNHLQRRSITVPDLMADQRPGTVPTAVVTTSKQTSTDSIPLMLLPGFDSSALEFAI
ncbi:MAG: hypothetical protein ACFBSF_20220 [Leptolyngbyaceae cyanobacterium]